ncbi:MAG: hypothetical protein PHW13_11960 [Methylococcales bacterium]|nr:hypothetical protein [Methylococcales bacterium]
MKIGNSPQGVYSDSGAQLLALLGPDGEQYRLNQQDPLIYGSLSALMADKVSGALLPGPYSILNTTANLAIDVELSGGVYIITGSGNYVSYAGLSADSAAGDLPVGTYQAGGQIYYWNGATLAQITSNSTTNNGAVIAVVLQAGEANAAANSTAIQTALGNGGLIQILNPGIYYVNTTHYIPSYTTVEIGADVELTQVPGGTFTSFFQNVTSVPALVDVSSITYEYVAPTYPLNNGGSPVAYSLLIATVTTTAAHGLSVGNSVLIDGDIQKRSIGGHVVDAVPSSTTFTFRMAVSNSGALPNNTASVPAATFTSTVTGNVLTVSAASANTLTVGQTIFSAASGFVPGTIITQQKTGTIGGAGTYEISNSMTISSSSSFNAMAQQITMSKCDTDISIIGAGRMNGNFIEGGMHPHTTAGVDDYFNTGIMLNNVIRPYVGGGAYGKLTIDDCGYSCVGIARAEDPSVTNLFGNNSEDFVHFFGPIFGFAEQRKFSGSLSDDGGVFECDPPANYAPLLPPLCGGSFYGGGIMDDFEFKMGGNSGSAAIYPSMSNGGANIGVTNYRMYGTYTVQNIRSHHGYNDGAGFNAAVALGSSYNNDVGFIDRLVIDNVQDQITLGNPTGSLAIPIYTQSVEILDHTSKFPGNTSTSIAIGNISIPTLIVDGPDITVPQSTNPAVNLSYDYLDFYAGSQIGYLIFKNPTLKTLDSTASVNLFGYQVSGLDIGPITVENGNLGNNCYYLNSGGTYTPGNTQVLNLVNCIFPSSIYPITNGGGNYEINLTGGSCSAQPFNCYGGTTKFKVLNFDAPANTSLFANQAGVTINKWVSGNRYQSAAPVTGGSVNISQQTGDDSVVIAPAGALANLDLNFPTNGNSIDGETREVRITQNITALAGSGGTIIGLPASVSAGWSRKFMFSTAAGGWC